MNIVWMQSPTDIQQGDWRKVQAFHIPSVPKSTHDRGTWYLLHGETCIVSETSVYGVNTENSSWEFA